MGRAPVLATDSAPCAMELVVDRWRAMSPAATLQAVAEANRSVDALAAAGVRRR